MNTYELKKKHEKATEILECIETADQRIKTNLEFINGFPGTFPRLEVKYRQEIAATKAAKAKLIKFYFKTINA